MVLTNRVTGAPILVEAKKIRSYWRHTSPNTPSHTRVKVQEEGYEIIYYITESYNEVEILIQSEGK